MVFLTSCTAKQAKLEIDPSITTAVNARLDTMQTKADLQSNSYDSHLFNTDIRVSINESPFYDATIIGGVAVRKNGSFVFGYKLFESAGPTIRLLVDEDGRINKATFQIIGDGSPRIQTTNAHINRIMFNREQEEGKSFCFFIDLEPSTSLRTRSNSYMKQIKLYGYINKVVAESQLLFQ